MRKTLSVMMLLLIVAGAMGKGPKYVFYFIGDGMGPSHVLGTELFLGEKEGVIGRPKKLCFAQFPHTAFVTTFSASNGVTDSAASGTALATGHKTNNGHLGVTPDGEPVYSVAHAAKEAGYAVGLATTVCINHATPGAFYAHNNSRNNYHDIAQDMIDADYDFYAGGDVKCSDEQRKAFYTKAGEHGYAIARGYSDYFVKSSYAKKMMLYQEEVREDIPYAIDRDHKDLTLAQITDAAIDFLQDKSKKGFFLMVEGGKIDYASHSDDAATVFHETLDFAAAIARAVEFYKKHSKETLIIVTADHETGGLVLGYSGAYKLNLRALDCQKASEDKLKSIMRTKAMQRMVMQWEDMQAVISENTGLWGELKPSKDEEKAMKQLFEEGNTNPEKRVEKFEAIATVAKNAVNRIALVSWASPNHSGTFVPLFAIGKGAEEFHGVIDNTDIPKMIEKVAGYK